MPKTLKSIKVPPANSIHPDHFHAQESVFFFFFLTRGMENLSQLVTQEDYLCLQVLRITHHCYGLALNTSRSPRKEASAWHKSLYKGL
jgi:hypothetical protein